MGRRGDCITNGLKALVNSDRIRNLMVYCAYTVLDFMISGIADDIVIAGMESDETCSMDNDDLEFASLWLESILSAIPDEPVDLGNCWECNCLRMDLAMDLLLSGQKIKLV